jgi:hypothetical protein
MNRPADDATPDPTTPAEAPAADAAGGVGNSVARRVAAVAVVGLFLAAIGGGVWLMYSALFGGQRTAYVPPPPPPQNAFAEGMQRARQEWNRRAQANANADGVRPATQGGGFEVRAGTATARVTQARDGKWDARFLINDPALLPPDERRVLRAATDLQRDPIANEVGLTPDQKQKLAALGRDPGLVVSDADKAAFLEVWRTWSTAPDAEAKLRAQRGVVQKLTDIAAASLSATRAAHEARVKAVLEIIDAKVIEKWQQTRRAAN